jgi:hypothetical protein
MPADTHFRLRSRRRMRLPARISARDSSIALDTLLIDLSLEGACIELPMPVGVGDRVSLTLDLPGLWDPLVLEAFVAWTEPAHGEERARAGIRFSSPAGRSLLLIGDLVAQQ